MIDIVLLTREPNGDKNNWVIATQETDKNTGKFWRGVVFGKGVTGFKGCSFVEVDNELDNFISNRKGTGYVEQVRMKIYFPAEKIIRFLQRYAPKMQELSKEISEMILKNC
ncbi:MAG: hypothetical protein WC119_00820 [Synergistaceae bacterium]